MSFNTGIKLLADCRSKNRIQTKIISLKTLTMDTRLMKTKTQANTRTNNKKKWASYATAAAAIAVGAQTAEADIVHVTVNETVNGQGSGGVDTFDVLVGSGNGLRLEHSLIGYQTPPNGEGFVRLQGNARFSGQIVTITTSSSTFQRSYVNNLSESPMNFVSQAEDFLANELAGRAILFNNYDNFPNQQFGNAPGEHFIGFQFTDGAGDLQHGWVRLDLADTVVQEFTVVDFAYSTRGENITVGQTVAVPEPGSLGMLALGALGLAATRRRRNTEPSNN